MQSIQTKYLCPTNFKGSRIKAWCERGSITVSYPDEMSGDACHIYAVDKLIAKFNNEDQAKYGPNSITTGRGWNSPRACGQLPDQTYAHIFIV